MRLLANYSKKVGEENYSNSSYSVTVETTTEVTAEKISEKIDYLLLEAREGVNRQIESAKGNHQITNKNGLNDGGNGKSKHSEDIANTNNRLTQGNNSNQYNGNNNRFENQKQSNTNGNNNGGGGNGGNGGNGNGSSSNGNGNGNGNGHVTPKQLQLIFGIMSSLGIKDKAEYLQNKWNVDYSRISEISKKVGSKIIDTLLKIKNNGVEA